MSKNTNRSTKQTIWMTIERFVRQMLGCCRSRVCSEGHLLQLRMMLIIGIIFFMPPPPTPHRHKREVPENSGTEVKYIFTSFADNKTDLQFSSICEDGCDFTRNVKGSLKRNVEFFISICAYDSVIDIITKGYRNPFYSQTITKFFQEQWFGTLEL